MKKFTFGLFAFLLATAALLSCNKNGVPPVPGQLLATKDTVRAGQPDSLIVTGADADSVLWSVSPSGFHTLIQHKNKVRITFSKKGSYVVSASVNGAAPLTKTITVLDSISPTQYVSLNGYQLLLKPRYHQSADSTYIFIDAQTTTQTGCANSQLGSYRIYPGSNHHVGFHGIYTHAGANCQVTGDRYARATVALHSNHNSGSFLANGTYPFKVSMGDNTYTGTFTVTATNITFNWPHTSPMTISPTTISR